MLVTVRMLCDARGAPLGHTVHEYAAGCEYDVPAELAQAFFAMGVAEVGYIRSDGKVPLEAHEEAAPKAAAEPAADVAPAPPAPARTVPRTRRTKVRA